MEGYRGHEKRLGIKKASKEFNVPKSTLANRKKQLGISVQGENDDDKKEKNNFLEPPCIVLPVWLWLWNVTQECSKGLKTSCYRKASIIKSFL